jgi:hypothetical protein
MSLGPRDTSSLVNLTGWDAAELKSFQLSDGTTYAAIVAQMNAALGGLNSEFATDPIFAGLVSYTDQPEVEYRVSGSNGFEEHTEYGRPDAKRADTDGHMLPLKAYDRGLGWTWDYLQDARMPQIQADIADAIKDARDLFRVRLLTRLLTRGDESGKAAGLGTTGLSPGFATTAGSTGVDFTPPTYGGTAFASTHEHYVAIAGGVYTNAVFTDAAAELREHGHQPPYTFLVSPTDAGQFTSANLTSFVETAKTNIRYGGGVDLAMVNDIEVSPGVYPLGVIHDFVVWVMPGMPQYYGVGYKSYGANSQRNPLRVRLHKGMNRLQFTAFTDPRAGNPTTPIQYMMLYSRFGVGVGDRTAATPRYVNNAAWSDGTPT